MALRGSRELAARLKAIKQTFKPLGRDWADRTVTQLNRRAPQKTGKLRRSFRRKSATQKRATVAGLYYGLIQDAGSVPHPIKAKTASRLVFQKNGRTIFAKRVNHPGHKAQQFRKPAATAALNEVPMAQHMIDLWNKAAN